MDCIGRYNGVDYRQQGVCDVLSVKVRARWYFAYVDGKPTGDHYRTIAEFKASVDSGHFDRLTD
jgi:hypothetical protein